MTFKSAYLTATLLLCGGFGFGFAQPRGADGAEAVGAAATARATVATGEPATARATATTHATVAASETATARTAATAGTLAAQRTTASKSAAAPALTINQKRQERGLTSQSTLFVPKGQWIFGASASYSTHSNEGYSFLVIEGIDSEGHTLRVSPMIAYALHDNMALGLRFIYDRTLLRIDNARVKLGDEESGIDIGIEDFYALKHSYTGAIFWRQYIPLGASKRFAIFTDMQFAAGGTQAKFAMDSPVKGTFERGYKLSLGVTPGLVAFATNNMAIEVSVGVMGLNYASAKQVHNQVTTGRRTSSNMNFKVNIFSIGLGIAFYL